LRIGLFMPEPGRECYERNPSRSRKMPGSI